jgi:hypothetical protein
MDWKSVRHDEWVLTCTPFVADSRRAGADLSF